MTNCRWTSTLGWATLFVLALGALPTSADAGWFGNAVGGFCYDYHRINCWPCPYIQPDRQHVYDAMEAQESNGWRRQNLLGAHHFDEKTSELTEAAKIKIRWTLTQVPEHRRTLFVSRGLTQDITDARVAAVEAAAIDVLQQGDMPAVQDTHIVAEGRSAGTITDIRGRFRESQPAPMLPAPSGEDQ